MTTFDVLQSISIICLSVGVLWLLFAKGAGSGGSSMFDGLGTEIGDMVRPILPGLGISATSLVFFWVASTAEPGAVATIYRYAAWGAMTVGLVLMLLGAGVMVLERVGVLGRAEPDESEAARQPYRPE